MARGKDGEIVIMQALLIVGKRVFATHSIHPMHRGISADDFNRKWPSGFKYEIRRCDNEAQCWSIAFRAVRSWMIAEVSDDRPLCETLKDLEVWSELAINPLNATSISAVAQHVVTQDRFGNQML